MTKSPDPLWVTSVQIAAYLIMPGGDTYGLVNLANEVRGILLAGPPPPPPPTPPEPEAPAKRTDANGDVWTREPGRHRFLSGGGGIANWVTTLEDGQESWITWPDLVHEIGLADTQRQWTREKCGPGYLERTGYIDSDPAGGAL